MQESLVRKDYPEELVQLVITVQQAQKEIKESRARLGKLVLSVSFYSYNFILLSLILFFVIFIFRLIVVYVLF